MNVKTFQAPSIAEAVAKVKQDLGPTAVILHTRSFKRGGVMGIGAQTVVEITAGANLNMPSRKPARARIQSQGSQSLGSRSQSATAVLDEPEPRHPLRAAYAA